MPGFFCFSTLSPSTLPHFSLSISFHPNNSCALHTRQGALFVLPFIYPPLFSRRVPIMIEPQLERCPGGREKSREEEEWARATSRRQRCTTKPNRPSSRVSVLCCQTTFRRASRALPSPVAVECNDENSCGVRGGLRGPQSAGEEAASFDWVAACLPLSLLRWPRQTDTRSL